MTNTVVSLDPSFISTVQYIKSLQHVDGAIPWYTDGKLDPWDHVEAAMALSIGGEIKAAELAYRWLAQNQLADGSWLASYFTQDTLSPLRETNFVAYVATGIWHHYLITKDKQFLLEFQPMAEKAIDFVLSHQQAEGDMAWAVNESGEPENDALLTACCSILRSIDCAIQIHTTLNLPTGTWIRAAERLKETILHKPHRFDRTWESKARFAMDWYYPILAGLYSPEKSGEILDTRWEAFVEPTLGCRCVSDEPWVTMAETCELVLAMVAANRKTEAMELFNTLEQWRDEDGGYWTGFVFRDKTIWPEEKTAWTAGAVILAADALYQLTPAHGLFTQNLTYVK